MRLTSSHPSDDELLAHLDGETSSERADVLHAHLLRCEACATRVDVLRTTAGRVTTMLRADRATSQLPRRARLQRAMRETAIADRASSSVARGWQGSWLQAAAMVLLLIAGAAVVAMLRDEAASTSPGHIDARLDGRGALPSRLATPGAVSPHTARELCDGQRPSRLVDDRTRREVLASYDMTDVAADEYELDALITPELGGTTAAANLWPQRYDSPVWNARVKDDLERLLPAMVCRGDIDLATAQQAIARDWIAAYKRFFDTDVPLLVDRSQPDDDDDLILVSASVRR